MATAWPNWGSAGRGGEMLRNKKAQRGLGGGQMTTAANQLSTPQYSLDSPQLQALCKPWISGPLDQAIAQIERHRALARFHYEQVLKHKLIKRELENLAFGGTYD